MLEQFNYDKCVGIPFVLLFSIPIIGYSAPLIALIAPKYLPSTLITPKQKVLFQYKKLFIILYLKNKILG